jgi:hypothetical protein
MKYMLMMHSRGNCAEMLASWSPDDLRSHVRFMLRLNDELKASGELVLAEGLDMPDKVKVVKATQPGKPLVTDGPFPETKEFLAGFLIVEVPSEQQALAIAARMSVAPGPGGTPLGIPIEVRQVMSAPEV